MHAQPTFTAIINGHRFDWYGGAYIEITSPGDDEPTDVINVWDYARDEPVILPTYRAFMLECAMWIIDAHND